MASSTTNTLGAVATVDASPATPGGGAASSLPRLGVIDFDKDYLVSTLLLRERLRGRVEFCFYQQKPDTPHLVRAAGAPLVLAFGERVPPWAGSEDELLEAVGRHELILAPNVPQLLAESRRLLASLEVFLDRHRPTHLWLWNGNPRARALAAHLGRRRGLGLIYSEHGYLPGTMQMDLAGVNFASSHTAAIAAGAYRDFEPDRPALAALLAQLREGRTAPDAVPLPKLKAPWPQRLRREVERFATPQPWHWLRRLADGPVRGVFVPRLADPQATPCVLLPLQVYRDSQLTLHSPLVGQALERLVLASYLALRQVRPGWRLVVKLHPAELQHTREAWRPLAAKLPDAVFVHGQAIQPLLRDCAAVITVNSTVGIEAMAFGKPVVTAGRSLYTVAPLVTPLASLAALPATLARALDEPPAAAERERFLGYLAQRVLVSGSYRDLSERSLAALANGLLGALAAAPGTAPR